MSSLRKNNKKVEGFCKTTTNNGRIKEMMMRCIPHLLCSCSKYHQPPRGRLAPAIQRETDRETVPHIGAEVRAHGRVNVRKAVMS